MKKTLIFNLLLIGLNVLSCKSNTEEYDSVVEMIPVHLNKSKSLPIEEIIDKIELIPLETNDDCLLHSYRKMVYYKEIEIFAIFDIKCDVYLFSKEGKFISNSLEARGQGPRQYWMGADMLYNPYSKCIEVLGPWGTIYRYDTLFNFVEKISLEQNELVFNHFEALSETQYILATAPSFISDLVVHFCDFEKKTIEKTVNYEKHLLGGPHMQNQFFLRFDDDFLFTPLGFDYHFYQIKTDLSTITPVIKLDFGGDEITKKQIERMTDFSFETERKQKDMSRRKELTTISAVLKETSINIPIVKLINDKYVYLHIFTNHKRSNYIYNRKTRKSYYQATDDPFKIYFGLQMDDNVLITMPQPYEIEKYVNKNYMSQHDIEIFDKILEDDNPIIVKYYLK